MAILKNLLALFLKILYNDSKINILAPCQWGRFLTGNAPIYFSGQEA